MGMPVSVHVRGAGVRVDGSPAHLRAEAAARAAFARLAEVERVFSVHRDDSVVQQLRTAGGDPRLGPPVVREVAELCARAAGWTEGWFEAVDDQGRFEPTGLVKGWAVERAARTVLDHLVAGDTGTDQAPGEGPGWQVLVDAGGDVAVLSQFAHAPEWMIGVEDPFARERTIARIPVRHGGVATSGAAARGLHVWNPKDRTARRSAWGSVTIVGPSLTWADVAATAVFAAGPAAVPWIRRQPGMVALLVDTAGTATTVTGPTHGPRPGFSQAL